MEEKRLIELLTKKLAGEASPGELIELKTLLSEYPDASDTEEVFNQIWHSPLKEEDMYLYYERHEEKYGGALESLHPTEASAPEPKKFRYSLAAFGLVLLLVSLAFLVFRNKSASPANFTEIITGKGVRKSIILPDDTKVWLNGDSRISYDPGMKKGNMRLVNLAGEAFFDVAHDAQHPFVIHTDKASIKVLGTALNVMAYPGAKKCETSLVRGSVELTLNDDSRQKILLKPSEKLVLIDQARGTTAGDNPGRKKGTTLLIEHIAHVKVADKEYVPETSWMDNKLIFENESLEEIVLKLERWYPPAKISITGHTIGHYQFTGAFERETVEQALAALQQVKFFNLKINENEIILF